MKTFFKVILSILFLGASFFIFILFVTNIYLPTPDILGEKIISSGVSFYDRNGKILLYKIGLKNSWISYDNIPPKIIKAVIIAEDANFFKHRGISFKGILRSIYLNLKSRDFDYGGSTITQQLVRNLFLTQQKTISRKLKEIILALQLEKKYSKSEILTYYLNSIYYGEGNIGIKTAAEYYFNKKLKDLTWAEAAILASIPKAPAWYAPINEKNIENLKERRNYILKKLKEAGEINEQEYQKSISENIKIVHNKYTGITAPHFIFEVIKELRQMFPNEDIEKLNLKVITTLDIQMQQIAEKAVFDGAEKNKKNYGGNNAALMATNPKTGEVLALVGSKNFFDESISGQVNVPFWYRQPGSTFKPISYATLLELGYPEETIIFDALTNFGNNYQPKNFDKKFKGPVSLKIALAESRNIPAVKVLYLANPEKVIDLARKSGMTYLKDWQSYGLSLGLGTAEVRMADLIRFYGALANEGKLVSQGLILRIIKGDQIIYEHIPKETQLISVETARILNNILKDIEARKGLYSPRTLSLTIFPGYEVAIKTGTTQFYQDAWTFGYTPNLVVGVWAGNTEGRQMNSLGASLVAALPIFHQFLNEVINQELIQPESFLLPQKRIVNKPMLNGSWVSNYGIHSILFFVDRNDPLGPIPENPYLDQQFIYWENGVQNWLNNFYYKSLIDNEDTSF